MKPVIVDTSLWVQWFRGRSVQSRQALQGRFLWMSPVVAAELGTGVRGREAALHLNRLLKPFEQNRRCVALTWEDFRRAGELLAALRWPSSPKLGDALIAISARKIGAEIWTLNTQDFKEMGKYLGVSIINPENTAAPI